MLWAANRAPWTGEEDEEESGAQRAAGGSVGVAPRTGTRTERWATRLKHGARAFLREDLVGRRSFPAGRPGLAPGPPLGKTWLTNKAPRPPPRGDSAWHQGLPSGRPGYQTRRQGPSQGDLAWPLRQHADGGDPAAHLYPHARPLAFARDRTQSKPSPPDHTSAHVRHPLPHQGRSKLWYPYCWGPCADALTMRTEQSLVRSPEA